VNTLPAKHGESYSIRELKRIGKAGRHDLARLAQELHRTEVAIENMWYKLGGHRKKNAAPIIRLGYKQNPAALADRFMQWRERGNASSTL